MLTKILDWVIDVDVAATLAAYAAIESGRAAGCDCADCRNFVAVRSRVYPEAFVKFAHSAGIDLEREVELACSGLVGIGATEYTGLFHLVGRLVEGPADVEQMDSSSWRVLYRSLAPGFSVAAGFGQGALDKAFAGLPLVDVNWEVTTDWVIPDPPTPGIARLRGSQ